MVSNVKYNEAIVTSNKDSILNSEKWCDGIWTRIEGQERSVLDYVIVRKGDVSVFEEMKIDEDKEYTPYHMEKTEMGNRFIYSDHCMISCTARWVFNDTGNNETKMKIDPRRYEEFERELEVEKVSELITEEGFPKCYTNWIKKVKEISKKYYMKKKRRKIGKCNRILLKSRRNINRKLKGTNMNKKEVLLLKKRKQLILEHMENERTRERLNKVESTIKKVQEAGGVDSSTFWEVKKRLMGKTANEVLGVKDEQGKKQEGPEEVKEVYRKYFNKLLQTAPAVTEEEIRREEDVKLVMSSMEKLCEVTEPVRTTKEKVRDIVVKLDQKKAGDCDDWNNEIIVQGGEEIVKSLTAIINLVDEKMVIPKEWQKMCIKTTNKKGDLSS